MDAGRPAAGAVLWADMGFGTCAASSRPLGTVDARGRVSLDTFYRDEWKAYWVCAGGKLVWMSPDAELPATINLGVTASLHTKVTANVCGE